MYLRAVEQYAQQGVITLPGLDEKIKLPYNLWFKYEGEVSSLSESLARTDLILKDQICLEYRGLVAKVMDWPLDQFKISCRADQIRTQIPDIDSINAYCYGHKHSHYMAYVIAKKKGLPLSKSIFADGHESAELLDEIGQQQALQDMLEKHNISLDVRKYTDEDFADIGGMLALYLAEKNPSNNLPAAPYRDSTKPRPVLQLPQFKKRNPVVEQIAMAFGY